ncbi:hypothetical protein ABBQ38_006508 [Trebouxia sp. C0009 RCD-2024]
MCRHGSNEYMLQVTIEQIQAVLEDLMISQLCTSTTMMRVRDNLCGPLHCIHLLQGSKAAKCPRPCPA